MVYGLVSADTKTCGSPLGLALSGVLRLAAGKHPRILTHFQTTVNKKNDPKRTFFGRQFYILNSSPNYHSSFDTFYFYAFVKFQLTVPQLQRTPTGTMSFCITCKIPLHFVHINMANKSWNASVRGWKSPLEKFAQLL